MRIAKKFSLISASVLISILTVNTGCTKQQKFNRHLGRATDFVKQEQFERAEIEYLNCIELDPTNGQGFARLGVLYYDEGCVTRAIPYLRRAKELLPEDAEVRIRIAMLQLAAGQRDEALKEIGFMIQKAPSHRDLPLLISDLANNARNIAESRQLLLSLPAKLQESAPVLCAQGILSLKEGRMDQGVGLIQRSIAVDPGYDMPHMILSSLYANQNNFDLAEQEIKKAAELAPANSSRRALYAQFKLRRGDVVAARALLEDLIKKQASLLQPYLLLADLQMAEKKYDEAGKLISKAIARDPMNPEAMFQQGRVFQAKGELDKAVGSLEKLMEAFPTHGPGAVQLASVYIGKNELAKANVILKTALANNPNFAEAGLLLAELDIRMNDTTAAVLILNDLIKRFPQSPRPRLVLAGAYRIQGRLDEAITLISRLANDFPKNPEYCILLGALNLQARKPVEARAAYERAFAASGNNPGALEQLINLDLAERKGKDSEARLLKLIGEGKFLPELNVLLGNVRQSLGNMEGAEAAFRQAISLKPDDKTAYFLLARLYVAQKQTDKALENLAIVSQKNPKDYSAWMLRGMLLEEKSQFEEAKVAYEKVLALNPKFVPALNNLAYLYAERFGRGGEAQEMASRARELQPHDPYAADTLGWILFRQGNYSWALSLIKESAEALPATPEVQYHLGMVHYMMGEEAAALSAFDSAVNLGGSFNGIDDCRRRLKLLTLDLNKPGAEAKAMLEKLREEQKDDPILLGRLAAVYVATGDKGKAVETYELILKLNPQNLNALRALSKLAVEAKDWNRASTYAKQVRKLAPEDAESGYALGLAALAGKDHKYAYSLLKESDRKMEGVASVVFDLGDSALSLGRLTEAKEVWTRALGLEASSPRALSTRRALSLLEAYQQPKIEAPALVEAEKLLSSDKTNLAALLVRAKALAPKNDKTSREALDATLEAYPDCSIAQRDLAIWLVSTNQDATKAYDVALKARESLMDDPALARALGILCAQKGEVGRAVQLLNEAARSQSDALLFFHLGLAQSKLKPPAPESKANLQKALSLGLPADLAAQAKSVIDPLKK